MKILLTLDFPPEQGGIQRYLFNMVKYSYGLSDRVLVGCSSIKTDESVSTLPCPVKYYSNLLSKKNKKITLINLFFALFKYVTRFKELRIEAGNIYAAIPVFLVSLIWPVKYIVYCYGKEIIPLGEKSFRALLFRCILIRAEKIGYISEHTASLLSYINVNHKLKYLPPRIEKDLLIDIKNKDLHNPVHLLSVGRLQEHKGHDFLVDLVALLPEKIDWKLTIAGSGPQYPFLEKKVADYKLHDRIVLTDAVSDLKLWEIYKNADIFLFPSRECNDSTEGFGIVLLEAMAQGLAIVASQVGGIVEVLDNGGCGLLVPPDHLQSWSEAIQKLIYDHGLRKSLIKNARSRVENQYVW